MFIYRLMWQLSTAVIVIAVLFMLAWYIFSSFATYRCLKAVDYKYPWQAWIPIVSGFAVALATNYDTVEVVPGFYVPVKVFMFFPLLRFILLYMPGIGWFLSVAIGVICYGWCYGQLFAVLEECVWEDVKVKGYISGAFPPVAYVLMLLDTKPIKES